MEVRFLANLSDLVDSFLVFGEAFFNNFFDSFFSTETTESGVFVGGRISAFVFSIGSAEISFFRDFNFTGDADFSGFAPVFLEGGSFFSSFAPVFSEGESFFSGFFFFDLDFTFFERSSLVCLVPSLAIEGETEEDSVLALCPEEEALGSWSNFTGI